MPTFRYKQNRLQQLRGFCAVVETRSVSKAAARLSLTQPTVSLQVQSLERDLGAALFERRGPKIELTFDGELLYDLARPLVEGLTALDQEFDARRNNLERGKLAIAAGESTIHYVLPRAVQQFSSRHPGVALTLNNVTGKQGLQQLRERLVDFCVGPMLDTPADIRIRACGCLRSGSDCGTWSSPGEAEEGVPARYQPVSADPASAPSQHVASGGDGVSATPVYLTRFDSKWVAGKSSSVTWNLAWESRSS